MRILRIGTLLAAVPLLAAVLAIHKDREYMPQLACSVVGLFREIEYCRAFVAAGNEEEKLAAIRKRQAEKEAEAAEQRRIEAEQKAQAAEAARRQAEEDAYAERRRQREAEREAEEAEQRRQEAVQRAREAEAARREAEIKPAIPQERVGPQQSISSYWMHNGSLVKMIRQGASVRLIYENPRQGMREEGVTRGTLLFEGQASDSSYDGTAYVFSGRCGTSFPYQVTGEVRQEGMEVRLFGKAPNLISPDCRVMGYRDDNLIFDRMN
jgi:hypothetical protein